MWLKDVLRGFSSLGIILDSILRWPTYYSPDFLSWSNYTNNCQVINCPYCGTHATVTTISDCIVLVLSAPYWLPVTFTMFFNQCIRIILDPLALSAGLFLSTVLNMNSFPAFDLIKYCFNHNTILLYFYLFSCFTFLATRVTFKPALTLGHTRWCWADTWFTVELQK